MAAVCLQCPEGDKRFARNRGLCLRCYGRCARAVRRKETSWVPLESAGLALPAQSRGRAWEKGSKAGKARKWE